MEVLVDRELGDNYDRIEVGEMLHVALLCTQYLPGDRPKMSEVVRMLAGDGMAEKWAASHNHNITNTNTFHPQNTNTTHGLKHDCSEHERSSMFGSAMDEDKDEDEHSLDSYAMELSGPR